MQGRGHGHAHFDEKYRIRGVRRSPLLPTLPGVPGVPGDPVEDKLPRRAGDSPRSELDPNPTPGRGDCLGVPPALTRSSRCFCFLELLLPPPPLDVGVPLLRLAEPLRRRELRLPGDLLREGDRAAMVGGGVSVLPNPLSALSSSAALGAASASSRSSKVGVWVPPSGVVASSAAWARLSLTPCMTTSSSCAPEARDDGSTVNDFTRGPLGLLSDAASVGTSASPATLSATSSPSVTSCDDDDRAVASAFVGLVAVEWLCPNQAGAPCVGPNVIPDPS